MLKIINRTWPFVSLALVIALLSAMIYWPGAVRPLGQIMIGSSFVMAAVFIILRQREAYNRGVIDQRTMVRNISLDLMGALLAIAATLVLAGSAAAVCNQVVAKAAEATWPGRGAIIGMLAGILAAVLVGLAAGFLVRWVWGVLTKPRIIASAKNGN